MIALLQRVTQASVSIEGKTTAKIDAGMLALVGVRATDNDENVQRLADKLIRFRLFSDEQDRMNLDLLQADKALLLVPQFTLAADTSKGRRPGFSTAASPDVAKLRFDDFCRALELRVKGLQKGTFGANMQVALVNDGPVTFWIEA